jgi:hypothetical protein
MDKEMSMRRTGSSVTHEAGEVTANTQTAVFLNKEDGTMRITRIEISGENVAHLF